MPRESPSQATIASFARVYSEAQLNTAIGQLQEAFLTGSFQNLSVLGMNIGSNLDHCTMILETMEAARALLLATEDVTGAVGDIAMDAKPPLSVGPDFSRRMIE